MMRVTHGALLVAVLAIVPPPGAAQSASSGTATAQGGPVLALSIPELRALVEEAETLQGKDEALAAEAKPALDKDQELSVEGDTMQPEIDSYEASCGNRTLEEGAHQACEARRIPLQARMDRWHAAKERNDAIIADLARRAQEIQGRLQEIDAILAAQQAFTDAADQCSDKTDLETQAQCMQMIWDGAQDQTTRVDDTGSIVTAPSAAPTPSTAGGPAVTLPPATGRTRTPEEAIEEFRASGPARPRVSRPTGGKEPPPPE